VKADAIRNDIPIVLQGKALLLQINTIKQQQAGNKCTILVPPANFPSLDAVIIIRGTVIGVQIKSNIVVNSLTSRIVHVRKTLADLGGDLLGPEGHLIYMIGIESAPAGLKLSRNEIVVTARQLRNHFLDVFFRFGLTGGESKYT
jgi:hypothetical protein